MKFSTLVLAAGEGTRMKSERPKVVHEMLGLPLVQWVVRAARKAGSAEVLTVVGYAREQVIPLVEDTLIVVQEEQLGTGHVIMVAREQLEELAAAGKADSLVVLNGDSPLISSQTIASLVNLQQLRQAAVCVLTQVAEDPSGYGRIVRDEAGNVVGIVEEKDASPAEKKIRECNSGAYSFDLRALLSCLDKLNAANAQGEYYLTDVLGILAQEGQRIIAHIAEDASETWGINSRLQLAQATKYMQQRINETFMMEGVTMLDPTLVLIGPDVKLENDIEILPMTILYGQTRIGKACKLGPNTRITSCKIGSGCTIDESVLIDSMLEDDVNVGPRAYLRPGTVMKQGSKAGTHVEIKKSTIGAHSKVPHLSYIGDATLGEGVNIGAGTITCNYDGMKKYPTLIGDKVFVGSDVMLVAPVKVGSGALIGAGSVISKDVPADSLAIERNDQRIVEGWAIRHFNKYSESSQE
ncbi:MAG: bifunctional UDP-N-acetylglucosamine diphosphorylase/glucosamine-1-phosphate N-acetyltransferase GlmU [Coriobacteriaceae bacterium]|nr:bifunctional UDP-N-acetylglucosamine diphosphorylase/glucosamine-1-phosphate N-acetyltransferase GlmU [Coriobacteriaceae bacterium]